MNWRLSQISFVLLSWLAAFSVTTPVAAETDLLPTDYQAPGDGRTPTLFQYLDTQGYSATPVRNLAGNSDKGDVIYNFVLELPPALLKPNLALSYSSAKGADHEMAYGWTLGGILEILRPTARASRFDRELYGNTGVFTTEILSYMIILCLTTFPPNSKLCAKSAG